MSKVYFPLISQVSTFNLPLIIYSDIQCIIGGNKFKMKKQDWKWHWYLDRVFKTFAPNKIL